MTNTIQIAGYYNTFRPRKDGSVSLAFETQEIRDEALIKKLMYLRGSFGVIIFATEGTKEVEVPPIPSPDEFDGTKSHSQRQRGILWHLWKAETGGEGDFESYYRVKMESVITHWKNKLEQIQLQRDNLTTTVG